MRGGGGGEGGGRGCQKQVTKWVGHCVLGAVNLGYRGRRRRSLLTFSWPDLTSAPHSAGRLTGMVPYGLARSCGAVRKHT